MRGLTQAALVLTAVSPAFASLPPIVKKGSTLVDSSTNQRFAIIGVDYQPGGSSGAGTGNGDPLSDGVACLRDAVLMQKLGVNTIRIYNIDPTLNHDLCMSIFDAAGIYVILDVNSPLSGQYLDRSNPAGTYNSGYMSHVFNVIEAFKGYTNILGFFAGNEIINDVPTAGPNPPYIRAIQRDMKNYIAKHAKRSIPVGYSAADVDTILQDNWEYLQCDNGDSSSSDFFGLNSYSWCGGDATYESAGYNKLVAMFAPTTIPIFFSEYGCNLVAPRVFDEVQALYGPNMTLLSGGLVYEWSQEGNDYGLVTINSNASLNLGGDYMNLLAQYNKIDVGLIQAANNSAESATAPKCASKLISNSGFNNSFSIPSPPAGVQALINNGVTGAPTGAFASVTATTVTQGVFNTNGVALKNLVLKMSSNANTPSNATISGASSGTSASSTSSPTASKAAAPSSHVVAAGGLIAGFIGVLAAIL
ncbi:glycoside hydrolase family 72 protein [Myriangium duriaei CBS 260.36]|uniref:1,3-beta-glucanosyltransferase n=1 Tax=Myriangium duriaei CBS 260.36 TaxID=1168546 RepID=A0A9P4J9W9_9PEZI|nr:glycoside hydrolase family 72 protein [Myriangium duriaei CBS 260.36]